MPRVFIAWAGAILTILAAVIIAKAQVEPNGFWGWVLSSPHVVPALWMLAVILMAIGFGQWGPIRDFYWRVFVWLIPANGWVNVSDEAIVERAVKRGMYAFIAERTKEQEERAKEVESQHTPEEENPQITLPLAPAPKDPDLQGTIEEIIFRTGFADWMALNPKIQMLIKLALTNHGTKPAVIRSGRLKMDIGLETYNAERVPPPDGLKVSIRRNDKKEEAIIKDDPIDSREVFAQGIPHDIWMLFEFTPWVLGSQGVPEPPYNAKFVLTLVDSFNNEHSFVRLPMLYFRRGEMM